MNAYSSSKKLRIHQNDCFLNQNDSCEAKRLFSCLRRRGWVIYDAFIRVSTDQLRHSSYLVQLAEMPIPLLSSIFVCFLTHFGTALFSFYHSFPVYSEMESLVNTIRPFHSLVHLLGCFNANFIPLLKYTYMYICFVTLICMIQSNVLMIQSNDFYHPLPSATKKVV